MHIPEILSEQDLIVRLGLREGVSRSREVSAWMQKGLKCVKLSGTRYFRKKDILNFFDKLFEEQQKRP